MYLRTNTQLKENTEWFGREESMQKLPIKVQCCVQWGQHSRKRSNFKLCWWHGHGSPELYFVGSWSYKTLETWMCWSRNGGHTQVAVTSPATPVPRLMANLSSCIALLGSSASWPLVFSSPAWWLPWSCGGIATGATRRPPKRSVPWVLFLSFTA